MARNPIRMSRNCRPVPPISSHSSEMGRRTGSWSHAARAAWDQLPVRLPISDAWLLIGGTGLQFLLILIGFLAMPSTDGLQGYSVSWDFGAFIALIASITAAAPVVYPAAKTF